MKRDDNTASPTIEADRATERGGGEEGGAEAVEVMGAGG